MNYEWDPHKAQSNRQKHGVRFADAVTVFADDFAVTVADDFVDEERYAIIGQDAVNRILVVIFTYRGDNIRIISARKANSLENQAYRE